jgi:hypothetical protein
MLHHRCIAADRGGTRDEVNEQSDGLAGSDRDDEDEADGGGEVHALCTLVLDTIPSQTTGDGE